MFYFHTLSRTSKSKGVDEERLIMESVSPLKLDSRLFYAKI